MLDDVKAMDVRYIDPYASAAAGVPTWRLTRVYGEPRTEDQHRMWSLLRDLHHQADMSVGCDWRFQRGHVGLRTFLQDSSLGTSDD